MAGYQEPTIATRTGTKCGAVLQHLIYTVDSRFKGRTNIFTVDPYGPDLLANKSLRRLAEEAVYAMSPKAIIINQWVISEHG